MSSIQEEGVLHGVLPGGTYTIRADRDAVVARITGASDAGSPHPIFASVATLAATGLPIADLCRRCNKSIDDGPMLGECEITFLGPLRFDVAYQVERHIESMTRKTSRRLGAMDLLRFTASMRAPDGDIAARVAYTWIFPIRRPQ